MKTTGYYLTIFRNNANSLLIIKTIITIFQKIKGDTSMKKLITSTPGTLSALLNLQFLVSHAAHERVKKIIDSSFMKYSMKNKFSVILFIICFNFIYTNSNSQGSLSFVRGDVRGPGNCGQLQIGIQYDLYLWDHIDLELFDITNNQPANFSGGCSSGLLVSNFPSVGGYFEPYCLYVTPGLWRISATVHRDPPLVTITSPPLIVDFDPNSPYVEIRAGASGVSCRSCNDAIITVLKSRDQCHIWKASIYRNLLLIESQLFENPFDVIFFDNLGPYLYRVDCLFWDGDSWNIYSTDYFTIRKPKLAKAKMKKQGRRRSNSLALGIERDNNLYVSDTAVVYLRNVNSPYDIVDTSKSALDSVGNGEFNFHNADVGTPYYIVATHRNSLETWSSSGQVFGSDSLMNYDFSTSASQAYGNNMVLVDGEWTFYSGDVNQDGVIDLLDLTLVYNDASTFVTGYVVSDVTGDSIVDLDDMLIVYENAYRFVAVMRP